MTVNEVVRILNARVLVEGDMEAEIKTACGSDMMSDVLAFVKDQALLLTGLCNPQVIRTAEMMDMRCVVFVRGKGVDEAILRLAQDRGIIVLQTDYRMFTACGLLFEGGLRGECEQA